jgi:hypothetical protein
VENQVGEHHCYLAAFRTVHFGCGWRCRGGGFGWKRRVIDAFQFRYCAQQQTSMAELRHTDLFEVLITKIRQDDKADVILGKALSALRKTQLPQPV